MGTGISDVNTNSKNIKNWNIVEELSDMAWGMPADEVRAPDVPMAVYLVEGQGLQYWSL